MQDRRSECGTTRDLSVIVCHAVETEQCHNGSVDFDTLARQHKDAVYRQMIRVCGNREDAEDVLIEALLKAYRHLDQLRESAAFRAWLVQIAKRVCWQLKERESLIPLLQLSMLGRRPRGSRNRVSSRCATGTATDEATAERSHRCVARALPPGLRVTRCRRSAGRRSRAEAGNLASRHEIAVAPGPQSGEGSPRRRACSSSCEIAVR